MTPAQTAATYDQIAQNWDHPGFDQSNGIAQLERALKFASVKGSALTSVVAAAGV